MNRAALKAAKPEPPDRIVVGWCENGHLDCAVLPNETSKLVDRCVDCPPGVKVHRVRYQLAVRRGA